MSEVEYVSKYKLQRALKGRLVFVSGTNEDMSELRAAATAAIAHVGHRANDPHHTSHSAQDVCELLTQELRHRADFYVGVFGFRYGSRIRDDDEEAISYTEFEFNLARERWLDGLRRDPAVPPPIFVFLPARGSAIESDMRDRSRAHLLKLFKGDKGRTERDMDRQSLFLGGVWKTPIPGADDVRDGILFATGNRNCNIYNSVNELQGQISRALLYSSVDAVQYLLDSDNDDTVSSNAPIPAPPPSAPPGVIEAEQLIAAFDKASRDKHAPGLCLVLRARNPRDLNAAATELGLRNPWDDDEPGRKLDLIPKEGRNIQIIDLWQQIWDAANLGRWDDWDNADELAAGLVDDLDRPVTIFFHNVHRLQGGLALFADKLWTPLRDALARRMARSVDNSRARNLLLVLTWQGGEPSVGDKRVTAVPRNGVSDYSKLVFVEAAGPPPSDNIARRTQST